LESSPPLLDEISPVAPKIVQRRALLLSPIRHPTGALTGRQAGYKTITFEMAAPENTEEVQKFIDTNVQDTWKRRTTLATNQRSLEGDCQSFQGRPVAILTLASAC